MRTTLLGSLLLLAIGCNGATEINSAPSSATPATSAGERAQTAFFYQIDQNGDVLHFEVPAYLAAQIAAAYGRPDLVDVLRAEVEAINHQLAAFDASNQSFEQADALIQAMNAALTLHLNTADPRTLVFTLGSK